MIQGYEPLLAIIMMDKGRTSLGQIQATEEQVQRQENLVGLGTGETWYEREVERGH